MPDHDVIIVGARCAGSPLAMLLARTGLKVLLVDRATFPSDTVSTHLVHPLGVAALARWGLLDRLVATGCPPIDTYAFDFGPFELAGSPGTDESPVAYGPRRTVLDKLLVDAAAEAGAELREGFTVDEVVIEDGRAAGIRGHGRDGAAATERARIVVGADGLQSTVARAVGAEAYDEKPPLLVGYYAYWSGLPMAGRAEFYARDRRAFAVWPTHDGLTVVIAGWPHAEFEANKKDIEGNWLRTIALAPAFAERLRGARRETRFAGKAVPSYFRKPFGPGWVLVGDAGYNKDFITAQGMMDAFHDAERTAAAIESHLAGAQSWDAAMTACRQARDETARPMYDYTCTLATLEPPPPEMEALLASLHGNQDAMDDYARMNAGTLSPATFFAAEPAGAG